MKELALALFLSSTVLLALTVVISVAAKILPILGAVSLITFLVFVVCCIKENKRGEFE